MRDAGNHAFVAHASHGVQFKHTISYNTEGDAYWWDPGPDTDDVLYDFAVAALVTDPEDGPDKFRLCGFQMMQGTGNTARNSVAVGVQGSTTSAGFHWPEEGDPHGEWTFQGNVSHNNALQGPSTGRTTPGSTTSRTRSSTTTASTASTRAPTSTPTSSRA